MLLIYTKIAEIYRYFTKKFMVNTLTIIYSLIKVNKNNNQWFFAESVNTVASCVFYVLR